MHTIMLYEIIIVLLGDTLAVYKEAMHVLSCPSGKATCQGNESNLQLIVSRTLRFSLLWPARNRMSPTITWAQKRIFSPGQTLKGCCSPRQYLDYSIQRRL